MTMTESPQIGGRPPTPVTGQRSSMSWRTASRIGTKVLELPGASVTIAVLVLFAIITGIHPDFASANNLEDILQSSVYVALLGAGMAWIIAMRDIDLSVGSALGLCLTVAALLMRGGLDPWICAAIGVALGGGLGLFNALVVSYVRIPTIITTLATLSMFEGISVGISGGQDVAGLPTQGSFFRVLGGTVGGFPDAFIALVIVCIPLAVVLHQTPFGQRVLAFGSNPDAAVFSGISERRVRMQVLVLIGLLAGFAGILALAFFTSADPTEGSGFELQAIAAAVIGGTPLRGGSASIYGAIVGAILLNLVLTSLPFFNVPVNWSEFATGVVILVAVGLDSLVRVRQRRMAAGISL
ncbi:MAG: ABC transporter permease [Acidimicrobiales bacterium]